jgi:peptide-methionine (S)-S-oxide reductase
MKETITLAGGCFWCTEAVFTQLKGVLSAIPGYSGGDKENPSYWDVASGRSGHAEAVQIEFDPKLINLKDILYVFFKLHDPTTLNRQGVDLGAEYRSAIFYRSPSQLQIAQDALKDSQQFYKNKIVTEITEFKNFYPADEWHKDYYLKNNGNMYCTLVIDPKIQKLKKEFGSLLKSNSD